LFFSASLNSSDSGLAAADADDLTQEVFIRLYRHLRAGNRFSDLRPWLLRVARNLLLDWRKANQRERAAVAIHRMGADEGEDLRVHSDGWNVVVGGVLEAGYAGRKDNLPRILRTAPAGAQGRTDQRRVTRNNHNRLGSGG
jgi:RNA polymerase sigma factor (sigma-70 family)